MKWLTLCALVFPCFALAQTRAVDPRDLTLTVTIEDGHVTPYRQEMLLLTIHGIYRRHITREILEQPDLSAFNWMQLGQDHWYESQLDGKTVKNFKRRMALYPDKTGTLTIEPFTHQLTLTDERDDWFPYDVRSTPITVQVAPEPQPDDWWFPVRRLEVSDQWSNAPDQLKDGDGVLRVIRITAVGVAPEMIPPMPELKSPSAMIFPHPEKRLVELSPQGPVSVAFWRWTIRPTNGASAILEPLTFNYFDTVARKSHQVKISAQRVAMEETVQVPAELSLVAEARMNPTMVIGMAIIAFIAGLVALVSGRSFRVSFWPGFLRHFSPGRRAVRRAARAKDLPQLRRTAVKLMRNEGADARRAKLLRDFDEAMFGAEGPEKIEPRDFAKRFLSAWPKGPCS